MIVRIAVTFLTVVLVGTSGGDEAWAEARPIWAIRVTRPAPVPTAVETGAFLVHPNGDVNAVWRPNALLGGITASPGGHRAALSLLRLPAGGCDLDVLPAQGPPVRRVTRVAPPTCVTYPRWSPVGGLIAYVRGGDIVVTDLGGASTSTVLSFPASTPDVEGLTWSPDGRRIAFARPSVRHVARLLVVRSDGAGLRVVHRCATDLCRSGIGISDPAWSPDGRRIAFVQERNLYTVDRRGRHLRQLTECPQTKRFQPCTASSPSWSPRGDRIAFVRDDRIVVLRLSTGRQRTLESVARVRAIAWDQ